MLDELHLDLSRLRCRLLYRLCTPPKKNDVLICLVYDWDMLEMFGGHAWELVWEVWGMFWMYDRGYLKGFSECT